jgi:membrane-associated protease RseP (regulator of RpoE activity)
MDNTTEALRSAASDVMAIEDVTEGVTSPYVVFLGSPPPRPDERGQGVRLRGRLLLPPDEAYSRLSQRFALLGFTPLLRREDESPTRQVILALPGQLRRANQRLGVAGLLFGLTVLSCLFAGAQMVEGLVEVNTNLLDGLPYAAALLGILAAHEMGHYLTGRRLGAATSLPYFIPMPLGFGTFGAVISMAAPPRNRRHLLAIAAAGPLAGLAVAIPVLLIGLSLSRVEPLPAAGEYMMEGNSLLYAALKFLVFGQLLPANGLDVMIHPVAFAGWAGILVTGLNLIPAGQLDGGHIIYALLGERWAQRVLWGVLALLAVLAFFWQGWILWLFLIFLFGRMRVAPLDDVTPLTARQQALAVAMIIVFALVFTPVPLRIIGA